MSESEDMLRLMEKLRDEGKMELRVNPETGEPEGTLTPEGEKAAQDIYRRILDMPDATIEELDAAIEEYMEEHGPGF